MKTITKETMNNISSLQKEISNLELQIKTKRDKINKELSQIGDIVEELAAYIKLNEYPTDIYPVFSYESGDYDKYKENAIRNLIKLIGQDFKGDLGISKNPQDLANTDSVW